MRFRLRGPFALVLFSAVLAACADSRDPGQRIWARRCAACHGKAGDGRTTFARNRPFADLTDGRWRQGSDATSIRRSVAEGVPKTTMEPFAQKLSPGEIDAVTAHVVRLAASHSR